MKKNLLLLFLCSFIITTIAKVIESNSIESINSYITGEDILIIFDIDNTLAMSEQEVGSDEWFMYLVNEKMREGYNYLSAVYAVLPMVYYAHFNITLKLTEKIIPTFIQNLTEKNICTMALTTRCLYLAERTSEQLTQLNIKFCFSKTTKEELILPMPLPCLFKYNILFSGNNDKGDALICFLDTIGYHPKTIIFIDDKFKNIHSVEMALMRRQISFIGIRYSGCDEKVHNFDPAKAQAQYAALQLQNSRST